MNIKTDPSIKVLLGVIATGVAALTALAFERRYQACRATHSFPGEDDGNPSKHPIEDGVENLKEKAVGWKDKATDGIERVTDIVKDGLKHGAEIIKEGT